MARINAKLIGWSNYFSLGPVSKAYHTIEWYTTARLRRWLRLKHKVQNSGLQRFPDEYLFGKLGLAVSASGSETFRGRKPDTLSESGMPEIGPSRSMSGMWRRSYGSSIATPPNERGGNS